MSEGRKNGLPYYKAYPRDFIEGTVGMGFELKAAYRLVLDLIYMHGGDLPDEPRHIAGLLGLSVRKWKSLREELIERGKIYVNGEFLANYRADKELESLRTLSEKQAEKRRGCRKNNDLEEPRKNRGKTIQSQIQKKKERGSSEEGTPSAREAAPARHPIPPDWTLTKSLGEALQGELSVADHSLRAEAAKFRDYYRGEGTLKADWGAAFGGWMRRAIERGDVTRVVSEAERERRRKILEADGIVVRPR